MKIVLFSSGSLSLALLDYIKRNFPDFYLVTKKDKPQGRGLKIKPNCVKKKALELSVNILEFDNLKNSGTLEYDQLKSILSNTDLAIVCDIGFIIPEDLIDKPKIFINIHPSLLPFYRGPSPIQYSLLNGDKLTGITICLLSKQVDKGDIIRQCIIKIEDTDNFLTLKEKLSFKIVEEFEKFLNSYISGNLYFFEQNDKFATYTKKIIDTKIDLNLPIYSIHNQVRAFYPNGYVLIDIKNEKKRLKILRTRVLEIKQVEQILQRTKNHDLFLFSKDRLFLKNIDSLVLEILEIQLEGKKISNAKDFINGYLS